MKFNLASELETLGLLPNEAKVYMASLKAGATTAQLLAAKSTISRPTTYIMIESLIKKGLMSSYIKGKKKLFAAANPSQLSYIVNNLKREALEKEAAVGKIVEALGKMVVDENSAMSVRLVDGSDSVQEVQKDIIDSDAKEISELINLDDTRKFVPPVYKDDVRDRLLKQLKSRVLYSSSKGPSSEFVALNSREVRYLSDKNKTLGGEVLVYADRVAFGSFATKPSYVIIRDGGLAQTMKTLFNALWEKADKE